MKKLLVLIGLLSAVLVSSSVPAQNKLIDQLKADLVSPWLVTVDGVNKPRILKITGVAQKADGAFFLDAVFGLSDGKLSPIRAEMSQKAQERTLTFATQTDTRIVATQTPNGAFVGTFTPKGGEAKKVTIERLSDGELQSKRAVAQSERAKTIIVKPAADVPAACAAFSGEWTGTWNQGNIGQNWLWITEVDVVNTKCMTKYSFLSHANSPRGSTPAEIKDGALSFICNSSTGGTCVFKRHGDTLRVDYSNPAGGRNSAIFERVQ